MRAPTRVVDAACGVDVMFVSSRIHRALRIEELEPRIALDAFLLTVKTPVMFSDSDGDLIRVALSGPTSGTGLVSLTGTGTQGVEIQSVLLTDTTAGHSLTIKDMNSTGGNTLWGGAVSGRGGLGQLSLTPWSRGVVSAQVSLSGSVGGITVGGDLRPIGTTGDPSIEVGGTAGKITLKGGLTDGDIHVGGGVKSLSVKGPVLDGSIKLDGTVGSVNVSRGVTGSELVVGAYAKRVALYGGVQDTAIVLQAAGGVVKVSGGLSSGGLTLGGGKASVSVSGNLGGAIFLPQGRDFSGSISVRGAVLPSGAIDLRGAVLPGAKIQISKDLQGVLGLDGDLPAGASAGISGNVVSTAGKAIVIGGTLAGIVKIGGVQTGAPGLNEIYVRRAMTGTVTARQFGNATVDGDWAGKWQAKSPGVGNLLRYDTRSTGALVPANAFAQVVAGGLSFAAARIFETGAGPQDVVAGDLDGDGRLDLVVANGEADSVSILLGDGAGAFRLSSEYPVGVLPLELAVSDLNGDRRLDIVVSGADGLAVLMGNGNGTFRGAVTYGIGAWPAGLAVGDITGDGRPDIIVGSGESEELVVLRGRGDGTFVQDTAIQLPDWPQTLAVADMNRDNRPDIIVGCLNGLYVLYAKGGGTFSEPVAYGTTTGYVGVAAARVNADPWMDIVTVTSDGAYTVLLGSLTTGFQTEIVRPLAAYPGRLAVSDMNRDNKPDLLVTNPFGNNLLIVTGNGDGTFMPPTTYPGGTLLGALSVEDFDGDGFKDVVVTNPGYDSIIFYKGRGDGSLQAAATLGAAPGIQDALAWDLNRDGFADLIFGGNAGLSVLLGNGNGTFSAAVSYGSGDLTNGLGVGDINADGLDDLVLANSDSSSVSVFYGNGDGSFRLGTTLTLGAGVAPVDVQIADLNRDGLKDLVVLCNGASAGAEVFLNEAGSLGSGVWYSVGDAPQQAVIEDVNADGKPDVIVLSQSEFWVLLGDGDGAFVVGSSAGAGSGAKRFALADLNGDGKSDIAVSNPASSILRILLGNGDGTFAFAASVSSVRFPEAVAIADVDGDSKADLIVTAGFGNCVAVLRGNGDGSFRSPVRYFASGDPQAIVVADLDRDGRKDIVAAGGLADAQTAASVLFNTGALGPSRSWSVALNSGAIELRIAYGEGGDFPQYAALHLDSGYLRMNYGPDSTWGTSVVVLPSFWSGGVYSQGAPVSVSWTTVGIDLVVSLSSTISGLHVAGTIRFAPPAQDSFTATISMETSGDVALDDRPGEAFKVLMLSSMRVSETLWDAASGFVNNTAYAIPDSGWVADPVALGGVFGLVGGFSTWQAQNANRPAPTVAVGLDRIMQVTGWVTSDANPNNDNVGLWAAANVVVGSWRYTVTATP